MAAAICSGLQRGISATASPVAGLYWTSFGPLEIIRFPLIYSGQGLRSTAVAEGVIKALTQEFLNFTLSHVGTIAGRYLSLLLSAFYQSVTNLFQLFWFLVQDEEFLETI